jgi:hypothetical protein
MPGRAKARRGELRISVPIGYIWHREANSDGATFVAKGALGGHSFDDILGGQYRWHPATTSKRAPSCFRKLWFKPL